METQNLHNNSFSPYTENILQSNTQQKCSFSNNRKHRKPLRARLCWNLLTKITQLQGLRDKKAKPGTQKQFIAVKNQDPPTDPQPLSGSGVEKPEEGWLLPSGQEQQLPEATARSKAQALRCGGWGCSHSEEVRAAS